MCASVAARADLTPADIYTCGFHLINVDLREVSQVLASFCQLQILSATGIVEQIINNKKLMCVSGGGGGVKMNA